MPMIISYQADVYTFINVYDISIHHNIVNGGIHGIGFMYNSHGYVKNNIIHDTGTSYWCSDTSSIDR